LTNPAFTMFKAQAAVLERDYGVKYSNKDPATAAWMLDTMEAAREAGDEKLRDCCAAGLMLRFWSYFINEKIGMNVEYDEKISKGWKAIELALEYKVWQDPSRGVNADQAVKKCIKTTFLRDNYQENLDKSRANHYAASMDEEISEMFGGEGKTTLGDTLADDDDLDYQARSSAEGNARALVQLYLNKKKIVEAIILDTIAFNDVMKTSKKVVEGRDPEGNPKKFTQVSKEFWPFRCVQLLSKLPQDYASYFGENYNFNPVEFGKALEAIRSANNQKLYRFLDRTLADARGNFSY